MSKSLNDEEIRSEWVYDPFVQYWIHRNRTITMRSKRTEHKMMKWVAYYVGDRVRAHGENPEDALLDLFNHYKERYSKTKEALNSKNFPF